MIPRTPVDRYAAVLLVLFLIIAIIFSRGQSYYRENSKNIEQPTDASTKMALREGLERRVAANALSEIGAIQILPALGPEGLVQAKESKQRLIYNLQYYVFYKDVTLSIIAIEIFNRPTITRWLKDHMVWVAAAGPGWQLPFSLGVGQVKIVRARDLNESELELTGNTPGEKLLNLVSLLIEPCSNVAAVASIVRQEFKRLEEQSSQAVTPVTRGIQELAFDVETLARRYNGATNPMLAARAQTEIFDYGVMVRRAFELLAGTHECKYGAQRRPDAEDCDKTEQEDSTDNNAGQKPAD